MTKGVFYSIGVGPGDPSLMTFKAARTIETCDVIFVPDSGGSENIALTIAAEHVKNKSVEICAMPMVRDMAKLREYREEAAAKIRVFLDAGQSAGFLTLGDPSIYSTAMYIHEILSSDGYETHIIPGVPSFCAAAAALNRTLCAGAEPLHIIPASYGGDFTELKGVKVLMKSGKAIGPIAETLKSREDCTAYMVRRASMPDEKVYTINEEPDPDYFTIVVVKPV